MIKINIKAEVRGETPFNPLILLREVVRVSGKNKAGGGDGYFMIGELDIFGVDNSDEEVIKGLKQALEHLVEDGILLQYQDQDRWKVRSNFSIKM